MIIQIISVSHISHLYELVFTPYDPTACSHLLSDPPAEDPEAEAAAAVRSLVDCDVVLTSYAVLAQVWTYEHVWRPQRSV